MSTARFFTFEGGEGVGKTTQMQLLREHLPELYPEREFLFTREPGGTEFAEKVRSIIINDAQDADGKTMFGLFAAARADHVRRVIRPALDAGKVVISDRFVAATCAYQLHAMENPISEDMFRAHYNDLDAHPDLTIILELDPEVAQARIMRRRASDVSHFDTRQLEFHHKLVEGYRRYSTMAAATFIDAGKSVEEVHEDIMKELRSRL